MRRISIGSWAYTIGPYADKPVDFETVCFRLKELGFDGVELGAFTPHPSPDDHPDSDSRAALREKLGSLGLGVSGLAANLWDEHLIDSPNHDSWLKEFTRNCQFALDLGIQGVRVDTVGGPQLVQQVGAERALQRVTSAFKDAARVADDHGLYVTWEFEPGFAFNKPTEILRVLDGVPNENFGVLYDTSHGHMCAVVGARHNDSPEILAGGQIELIDRLDGRINHIHLIDSDNSCHKDAKGEDETSMHLPFGEGVVDFEPLMKRLKRVDPGHDWWTIDLCFWPDAWDATAACKEWVDGQNEDRA